MKRKIVSRSEISLNDIRDMLSKVYSGRNYKEDAEREMAIIKIHDAYSSIGTVVFSLCGSPPKAFARMTINDTYGEGKKWAGTLTLYHAWGIKKKVYEDMNVPELETLPDVFYLPALGRLSYPFEMGRMKYAQALGFYPKPTKIE